MDNETTDMYVELGHYFEYTLHMVQWHNLIYGHDTISMLWGNMPFRVKWEIGKIL